MIKWFIRFFKIVPLGVSSFSNDSKVKECIYQDGLTTNNDYQSFRNPRYSKLGNIFIFYFLFKTKYHPISRQKQNEKLFFCIFFQEFKTHIFFLTSQKEFLRILNDVIKFINTKQDPFFLQKITTHVYLLYY